MTPTTRPAHADDCALNGSDPDMTCDCGYYERWLTTTRPALPPPWERARAADEDTTRPALTEPATVAGRELVHEHGMDIGTMRHISHARIREYAVAIEAEAVQAEREALVERVEAYLHEPCIVEIAYRESKRPGGLYTQHMPDAHRESARRLLGLDA